MPIPSRSECVTLMKKVSMPLHIQRHSVMVAKLSVALGNALNHNSTHLNLHLLEAGALLHDIAKAEGLATGERHDELGARMLFNMGYGQLASIVKEHVCLDAETVSGPVTESLIVNYADKRVMHERVVSLEDRFDDLMIRYGKTEEHRIYFRQRLELYLALEARIFDHLPFGPVDDRLMRMSLNGTTKDEWEGYED